MVWGFFDLCQPVEKQIFPQAEYRTSKGPVLF